MSHSCAQQILNSRRELLGAGSDSTRERQGRLHTAQAAEGHRPAEGVEGPRPAEGGCGVLGFAASPRIPGRHVLTASRQMHNRGNGKGGGIAMSGLDPAQTGVDAGTLKSHYLIQVALLDASARREVEEQFILPYFDLAHAHELGHLPDYRQVDGLEIKPPDVWRYFGRVKPAVLSRFAKEKGLAELPARAVEDEFVYQNTYRLNRQFYASLGEQRAFVLSHGRDLSVLKIVGYAEQVVEYYQLEDQSAHVWIAHQRYPTKGRVWHPGGAHPFIGLNEALVHNGDFANYHAVSEYLRQRNIGQLFLTDTEVSVQLFDLWDRVYGYPLEVTLEAMAPTTEHDFSMLPVEKQGLYRAVQRAHLHGSPDGPWFFILARSLPDEGRCELLGVTDTSMLRPQVFALYQNTPEDGSEPVQIGLIASERQAINACLRSLAHEDARFQPLADHYWVARGGSHTDGGAFRFTVAEGRLSCSNKFGEPVELEPGRRHMDRTRLHAGRAGSALRKEWERAAYRTFDDGGAQPFEAWLRSRAPEISWDEMAWGLQWLAEFSAGGDAEWRFGLEALTGLRDRRYPLGNKKRSSWLALLDAGLVEVLGRAPALDADSGAIGAQHLSWETRHALRPPGSALPEAPAGAAHTLVLDTCGFPPEGEEGAARWMARAFEQGWRHLIAYGWRGGRFAACGLGPAIAESRIDLYGDVGDYAASGLMGGEVHLHGDGQDQVGQILKSGRLVIHGDVGQTFLYGAKGGEVFVMGSAAGRPLINAVGRPRAVINGTCLDYLAESFMAGDPLNGGGFVVLNGVHFNEAGVLQDLPRAYDGGNLFSLASGGAIYLRDPYGRVSEDQLNGGHFTSLSDADWDLIHPYLEENERLFGICVDDLLTADGQPSDPTQVYRKVAVGTG